MTEAFDEVYVRSELEKGRLLDVLEALGRSARGRGRLYLTGGASALLFSWRDTTVDLDIRLDPEPAGVFEAIRDVKQNMDVNIELASPQDFIPRVPGWESRSLLVGRFGKIEVYHYDFYSQALSKLERGHERDLHDVERMLEDGLIELTRLHDLFLTIEPDLLRYPSLDPQSFRSKVEQFILSHGTRPDEE